MDLWGPRGKRSLASRGRYSTIWKTALHSLSNLLCCPVQRERDCAGMKKGDERNPILQWKSPQFWFQLSLCLSVSVWPGASTSPLGFRFFTRPEDLEGPSRSKSLTLFESMFRELPDSWTAEFSPPTHTWARSIWEVFPSCCVSAQPTADCWCLERNGALLLVMPLSCWLLSFYCSIWNFEEIGKLSGKNDWKNRLVFPSFVLIIFYTKYFPLGYFLFIIFFRLTF